MESAETNVVERLQKIMPALIEFRDELIHLRDERLSEVAYYSKFRNNQDTPNILPIHELFNLYVVMVDLKHKLVSFKKSFNENELPSATYNQFINIFTKVYSVDMDEAKPEKIFLGGSDVWRKTLRYVIDKWDSMSYEPRVRYSVEAYNLIKSRFHLIKLISEFETSLKN